MLLNKLKSYFLFPIFLFFFSDSVGVSFINNYKPENIFVTKIFTTNQNDDESYLLDELLSNVEDFINLPDTSNI